MRILKHILPGAAAILITLGAPGDSAASTQAPPLNNGGLRLSVGLIGQSLELRGDASEALSDAGIELGRVGTGVELLVGYRFGSRLSLNLRVSGSELDTGRDDVRAGVGLGLLEFVGHMRPNERVQPYLTGGFGGSGIVFEPDRGDPVTLEGVALSAGAGVDFLVGNHWTLGFAYRGALIDYENSMIELEGQAPVEFRGSALTHEFGFRWELRI